jgi:hypothetical protein
MSTKTPYEIRLELLQMSQSYFETIQNANLTAIQNLMCSAIASTEGHNMSDVQIKQMTDRFNQAFTPTYSVDDVIKHAKEMYSFINDNSAAAWMPSKK